MKPSPQLKRKAAKFANKNVIVKKSKLDQMIKGNLPLNKIRHKASNYDQVCLGANLLEDKMANAFVHASQNLVNNVIDNARLEHVNSLVNHIAELEAQLALLQADAVIAQAETAVEDVVTYIDTYIKVTNGVEEFVW